MENSHGHRDTDKVTGAGLLVALGIEDEPIVSTGQKASNWCANNNAAARYL